MPHGCFRLPSSRGPRLPPRSERIEPPESIRAGRRRAQRQSSSTSRHSRAWRPAGRRRPTPRGSRTSPSRESTRRSRSPGVASDPDDDIATYAWNWGDGTSTAGSASDQATHSYTTAGTYTVRLTVTDATALSVLFETSIAVRNNWAPESVSSSPATTADAYPRVGTPALFDFYGDDPEDPTGAGLNWDVDWGDGTAHGTGSSPYVTQISHTWSTPGTYVIHYSATDSDGTGGGNPNKTTFGTPILVTVAANPAPQSVSWSTDVVRSAINQTVTFTGFAQDPDGGALAKYEWDFNGDGVYEGLSTDSPTLPGTSQITHEFAQPGTYAVGLRVTDGDPPGGVGAGASTSYINTFIVTNPANGPYGNLYADIGDVYYGYNAKVNQSIDFFAGVSDPNGFVQGTHYVFHWGDGTADTSTASPDMVHTYASAGDYRPSVTITLSNAQVITVQFTAYTFDNNTNPYASYTYGVLHVVDNAPPAYAFAYVTNNTGCLHPNTSINFTLTGLDPDGGHIATFDVDWNADGTFDSLAIAATDDTASTNHTFTDDGTYEVVVRANDDDLPTRSLTDYYDTATVEITPDNCLPVGTRRTHPICRRPTTRSPSTPAIPTISTAERDLPVGLEPGRDLRLGRRIFNPHLRDRRHSQLHAQGHRQPGRRGYSKQSLVTHPGNHNPFYSALYISRYGAGHDRRRSSSTRAATTATARSRSTSGTGTATGIRPTNEPPVGLARLHHAGDVPSARNTGRQRRWDRRASRTTPSRSRHGCGPERDRSTGRRDEPHPANTIAFTASASSPNGAINQYTWHWGDGTADTVTTIAERVARVRERPALRRQRHGARHDQRDRTGPAQNVAVKTNWAPHAYFTVSAQCTTSGISITFDGSDTIDSDSAIASYLWDFDDGTNVSTNGPTTTHAFSSTGTYAVTLVPRTPATRSRRPTSAASRCRAGTAHRRTSTSRTRRRSLPAGSPITFTGHADDPDGTVSSYTWSWGDGTSDTISPTSGGSTTEHTFANPGLYTIQVIARDNLGLAGEAYIVAARGRRGQRGADRNAHNAGRRRVRDSRADIFRDSGQRRERLGVGHREHLQRVDRLGVARPDPRRDAAQERRGRSTARRRSPRGRTPPRHSRPTTRTTPGSAPAHVQGRPDASDDHAHDAGEQRSSTNDTTPTLSGMAGIASGDLASVTVKVYNGHNDARDRSRRAATTRNAMTGAYTVDASRPCPRARTPRSRDAAGRRREQCASSANTFDVDTTAPVVTLTNPANALSTNDTTPTYSGGATAAAGDWHHGHREDVRGCDRDGLAACRPSTPHAAARAGPIDGAIALAEGTYTAQARSSTPPATRARALRTRSSSTRRRRS